MSLAASAAEVLAGLSASRRRELDAAAVTLALVADWADLHPAEDQETAAHVVDRCTGVRLPIAGAGTPAVDGLAVVELGAVLGMSTGSALNLLGDVLELRHRLPGLWAAALSGAVPAWRARMVAQSTRMLAPEAVAFVDRQLAVVTGGIGPVRLARLVTAAVAKFMPDLAEAERVAAAEHRRFDVDFGDRVDGLASVSGCVDVADALDLEAAIADRAAELGREGWAGSLDVRRSIAAGDLARGQDTFYYTTDRDAPSTDTTSIDTTSTDTTSTDTTRSDTSDGDDADRARTDPASASRAVTVAAPGEQDAPAAAPSPMERRKRGQRVVLYVHLSDQALTGSGGLARLQNPDRPILTGVVRAWCGRPAPRS